MLQIARNLTDAEEGFLRGKKYLLMDRDTKFSEAFRSPRARRCGGCAVAATLSESVAAHRTFHADR